MPKQKVNIEIENDIENIKSTKKLKATKITKKKKKLKRDFYVEFDEIIKDLAITNDMIFKYVDKLLELKQEHGIYSLRKIDLHSIRSIILNVVPDEDFYFMYSDQGKLSQKTRKLIKIVDFYVKNSIAKKEIMCNHTDVYHRNFYNKEHVSIACYAYREFYKKGHVGNIRMCPYVVDIAEKVSYRQLNIILQNYDNYVKFIGTDRILEIFSKFDNASNLCNTSCFIQITNYVDEQMIVPILKKLFDTEFTDKCSGNFVYWTKYGTIKKDLSKNTFINILNYLIECDKLSFLRDEIHRLSDDYFSCVCEKINVVLNINIMSGLFVILLNGYDKYIISGDPCNKICDKIFSNIQPKTIHLRSLLLLKGSIYRAMITYLFNKNIVPNYEFLLQVSDLGELPLLSKVVSYKILPDTQCLNRAIINKKYYYAKHIIENYFVKADNSTVKEIIKHFEHICPLNDLSNYNLEYTNYVMDVCLEYDNYPFKHEKLYKLKNGHLLLFDDAIKCKQLKAVSKIGLDNKINPTQKHFDLVCSLSRYSDFLNLLLDRLGIDTYGEDSYYNDYYEFLSKKPVLYMLTEDNISSLKNNKGYNLENICLFLYRQVYLSKEE